MTDEPEFVSSVEEEFADGRVRIVARFTPGGRVTLSGYADDEVLVSVDVNANVFGNPQNRGMFLNELEGEIADHDPGEDAELDTEEVVAEIKSWFAEIHDALNRETMINAPPNVREILEATETPIVWNRGENSEWEVEMTMDGRTRTLTFNAGDLTAQGGAPLRVKVMNHFGRKIDLETDDWETIVDHWTAEENVVIGHESEESAKDVQANKLLDQLAHNLIPVTDREKLKNSREAVWFDAENSTGYSKKGTPADATIVWVQDAFLVDQMEQAGLDPTRDGEKANLLAHLAPSSRGDTYGPSMEKTWHGGQRPRPMYPFTPEALNLDEDDVGSGDPASSEVSV